ncbi:MAG: hypothetical protein IJD45_01080 [Clostridia bacterium]|nr:hypothetical protein [Clostridia bacterium]
MNTSLVLSGYALYCFMGLFAVLVIGFIFYSCAYVKEAREREKAEAKYRKLCRGYNRLIGEYQRITLRVPDIKLSRNATEKKNV